MHICYICSEYPPASHGGIGSFTQTIGRKLASRGHKITVVGLYPRTYIQTVTEEDDQGVHVIRLPIIDIPKIKWWINDRQLQQALAEHHRRSNMDIIESQEMGLAFMKRSFPVKKLIRMHGGHYFFRHAAGEKPRPWRSWRERNSFSKANFFCAVSEYVASENRRLLRMGNRPIEILPNPVDTDFFRPKPEIQEENGLIIFVGTVVEKKGVRELVQAMPQVISEVPDAHLWIIGRDTIDPVTKKSFREEVEKHIPAALKERIVMKGQIENSELPNILAQAQVCVFPSHMEAMPLAWIESLAMGKAVVASQTGPGREVIEDNVSGLLCDPHNPSSIAEKLIQLLKNADLRREMGQQARQRAVQLFSIDKLAERNEAFYERLLRSNEEVDSASVSKRTT